MSSLKRKLSIGADKKPLLKKKGFVGVGCSILNEEMISNFLFFFSVPMPQPHHPPRAIMERTANARFVREMGESQEQLFTKLTFPHRKKAEVELERKDKSFKKNCENS